MDTRSLTDRPRIHLARPALAPLLACLALAPAGCGTVGPLCGDGTLERDGLCVPVLAACADGTSLAEGRCVPACGPGQAWDGARCRPAGQCMEGTSLDQASGECVPSAAICRPGTAFVGGQCVPLVTCGPGTVPSAAGCVPAPPPPPDVVEDSASERVFTLPAIGSALTLGGTVDYPRDYNLDGALDADFDTFRFSAPAGARLRLTISGADVGRPAALVQAAPGAAAGAGYLRFCLSHAGASATRELYLPAAGDYQLIVSDYPQISAALYGAPTLPTGGSRFAYRVTIERLAAPVPTPVSGYPLEQQGDFAGGQLTYLAIPAGTPHPLLEVIALGVAPQAELSSTFAALLVLDGQGGLLHAPQAATTFDGAGSLIPADSLGYLVVVDYVAALDEQPTWALRLAALTPATCTNDSQCTGESFAAGSSRLLRFPLSGGDYFDLSPQVLSPAGYLLFSLLDERFERLQPDQFIPPGWRGLGRHYAQQATTLYAWLRDADERYGHEVALTHHRIATPALRDGDALTGLPVYEVLPFTIRDGLDSHTVVQIGLAHVPVTAGVLPFIGGLATHGSGWLWPHAYLLDRRFDRIGPAYDTLDSFPLSTFTPAFAWPLGDGHLLYAVFDPYASGLSGASYDARADVRPTLDLGLVTPDQPAERSGQFLSWAKNIYTFRAPARRWVEVQVDPALLSYNLRPEILVFNQGQPYMEFPMVMPGWEPDPTTSQLGLIAQAEAAGGGQIASTGFLCPYDGQNIVMVQDSNAGLFANYSLRVSLPPPPSNDTCDGAANLVLDSNGRIVLRANSGPANDDWSLPYDAEWYAYGSDVFYRLGLAAGQTVRVALDASFWASLYLFRSCAAIAGSGVATDDGSRQVSVEYQVPAGAGGTYYIGVDSLLWGGPFTLTVEVR